MTLLLVIFILLGAIALQNLFAMVLFSQVHSFWPAVPALGYWQTLVVQILINVIVSGYSSASKTIR